VAGQYEEEGVSADGVARGARGFGASHQGGNAGIALALVGGYVGQGLPYLPLEGRTPGGQLHKGGEGVKAPLKIAVQGLGKAEGLGAIGGGLGRASLLGEEGNLLGEEGNLLGEEGNLLGEEGNLLGEEGYFP